MQLILADDHTLFLDALEAYLNLLKPDIEIQKAASIECTMEKVNASDRTDLVMLDLNMPGMNEFEGLDRVRQALPEVPVVLMSGQAQASQVREGLRRGAAGFLPKDLDGQTMLKALELVLAGETYVPVLALDGDHAGPDNADAILIPPDNPLNQLTARQQSVLKLLAQGMTNKGIARELGLKEVTVAAHLGAIFRKLDVSRRTEAVLKAMQLGMQL